jgi:UDP-3-O-[3-hydroxymyristoyl] N-acetylglucosamine deacetylase
VKFRLGVTLVDAVREVTAITLSPEPSETGFVMMKMHRQTTLRAPVTLKGFGVHSGAAASLTIHPAASNHGIVFLRTGLADSGDRLIPARQSHVSATALCTVIGEHASGSVATIEHLMSALAGLGVDNALIEIGGPEMPIMDGSASEFVLAIQSIGLITLTAARRYVKVLKPVRIEQGRGFAELRPYDRGFRLDVEIDFDSPVIGRQRKIFDLEPTAYVREISRARTFGLMRDVEALWKAGFALGASLDNTIAIGDDKVVNPEGLRFSDEFARHKVLDAIGDLALAGHPILGQFRSYCGGHKMNVNVLEALFSDRSNYALVDAEAAGEVRPGQMAAAMPVPAYAPDHH